MPKLPTTEKLVATARKLARELEPQTHYNLPDLQTVIYSLLVSGMAEADVPGKIRRVAKCDCLSATDKRSRKYEDHALWSIEAKTRTEAKRAVQEAAIKEGHSEAKRLYGRNGILHDMDFDVDENGYISIERHN